MPFFRLETNVGKSSIDDGLKSALSKKIAELLKKPESYVIVAIIPSVDMIMGGTSEPCGNATLMSIGGIGVSENKKLSAEIFPILERHAGIKPDRCYIQFCDAEGANVGFNNSTFH